MYWCPLVLSVFNSCYELCGWNWSRRLVVCHGRFRTTYRSNREGSSGSRRIVLGLLDLWMCDRCAALFELLGPWRWTDISRNVGNTLPERAPQRKTGVLCLLDTHSHSESWMMAEQCCGLNCTLTLIIVCFLIYVHYKYCSSLFY